MNMGIEKADKERGGEFRTILRQQVSSLYGSLLMLDRIGLVSLHIRLRRSLDQTFCSLANSQTNKTSLLVISSTLGEEILRDISGSSS